MTQVVSPEAYFQDLPLDLPAVGELTPEEVLFLRQYAGLCVEQDAPPRACAASTEPPPAPPTTPPAPQPEAPAPTPAAVPHPPKAMPAQEAAQSTPAPAPDSLLRLVGFRVCGEEYFLPVAEVQEVVPFVPPTRLPAAPKAVAGITQLRGRVTPLVRLAELLEIPMRAEDQERFIVLCRGEGLQLGLVVHGLCAMAQVRHGEVEWNVEARLGEGNRLLAGIIPRQGRLTGILSVAAIVRAVLQP